MGSDSGKRQILLDCLDGGKITSKVWKAEIAGIEKILPALNERWGNGVINLAMGDDFMSVCLADNFEGVELILRIILGKKDIKIKSVRTQEPLENLRVSKAWRTG